VWVSQKEYKAVGEVLADVRSRQGITQEALSKKLRKPQSFVSSYESGQRRIDVLELLRVSAALGVDAGKVFANIMKRAADKAHF
jgi:transcriptional regulator with XRE-family HTH domain